MASWDAREAKPHSWDFSIVIYETNKNSPRRALKGIALLTGRRGA
jgi:hypothetical protein